MEEKLNVIEKVYALLQNMVSTKFGSAVLGFVLCGLIAYYSFMQRCSENVKSLQNELIDIRKVNDSLKNRITNVREEEREKAKKEQQIYFDYVYGMVNKMRAEVSDKKLKTTAEIEKLEEEIERRKIYE